MMPSNLPLSTEHGNLQEFIRERLSDLRDKKELSLRLSPRSIETSRSSQKIVAADRFKKKKDPLVLPKIRENALPAKPPRIPHSVSRSP
mmetsp:Transcript_33612/g.51775  ORF Transcript_33612/g.51775 Transcript_33612/m.51775 type:complete len:89 (-) Transcript_33612:2890-3156(-)